MTYLYCSYAERFIFIIAIATDIDMKEVLGILQVNVCDGITLIVIFHKSNAKDVAC